MDAFIYETALTLSNSLRYRYVRLPTYVAAQIFLYYDFSGHFYPTTRLDLTLLNWGNPYKDYNNW